MFKNSYQNGLLSIFYSCGSNPLAIWDIEVKNGHIKRVTDNEVNSIVLEIVSTNVATTYITCPKNNQVLGIKLPFLVMIIKNLKRYFSFEITILDDKNMRRRFRISNFQSTTKIKPFCTSMPIGLAGGWNQIQFNLADFTRRAYGTQFIETLRVQVHANARIRRIYFSEKLYAEEELPQDYKLYLPLERKKKKVDKKTEPMVPPAGTKVLSSMTAEKSIKSVPGDAPPVSETGDKTGEPTGDIIEEVPAEMEKADETTTVDGESAAVDETAAEEEQIEAPKSTDGESVVEQSVKEEPAEHTPLVEDITIEIPAEVASATPVSTEDAPKED